MAINDINLFWYAAPLDPTHSEALLQSFVRWGGAAWNAIFALSGSGALTLTDEVHLYISAAENTLPLVDVVCGLSGTTITAVESGVDTKLLANDYTWLLWNMTQQRELAWGKCFFHPSTPWVGALVPPSGALLAINNLSEISSNAAAAAARKNLQLYADPTTYIQQGGL